MEAKDKISFINSIEETFFCSQCGTQNPKDARFCQNCGYEINVMQQMEQPMFEEIVVESNASQENTTFRPTKQLPPLEFKRIDFNPGNEVEEDTVFATGFPDWSIEPPMVVVRRTHK